MNSMKQLQAQQEVRVSREDEARRLKLEEETSADMALLRAILDAEHRAREVEEAAQQRRTGLEERIQGRKDELLEQIRQETRAAIAADAAAEHQRADAEIAAEIAEPRAVAAADHLAAAHIPDSRQHAIAPVQNVESGYFMRGALDLCACRFSLCRIKPPFFCAYYLRTNFLFGG